MLGNKLSKKRTEGERWPPRKTSRRSDDEIVALLAKKQAALKEAKEAQAKAASKQAETKAADQADKQCHSQRWGHPPRWVQQVVPKKMPGFSTWFLPLLLLYSTRESLSHEQFLAAIVMLAVAV